MEPNTIFYTHAKRSMVGATGAESQNMFDDQKVLSSGSSREVTRGNRERLGRLGWIEVRDTKDGPPKTNVRNAPLLNCVRLYIFGGPVALRVKPRNVRMWPSGWGSTVNSA